VHPGDAERLSGPDDAPSDPDAGPRPTGFAHERGAGPGRFAWAITGSGHGLVESLALAARLPAVDLFLSPAAEEVLPMYGLGLEALRARFRVFRDKTASAVMVGTLYEHRYHTLVIAPATSNTVAKCALGLSDTLPTNLFAQAGKLGIPGWVFACDTEPVVVTRAPHDWVTLRPRNIEFENVERLRRVDHARVLCSVEALEAALDERLRELALAWTGPAPGPGAELPWTTSSS
jgi:flavoprotein